MSSRRYSEISSSWSTMCGEGGVVEGAAVEEKAHAAGPVSGRGRRKSTHTSRPLSTTEPALLAHLASARLPRRLPAVLHLAAGDRPPALVRRLEHEESARAVEDQSTRGRRDPRDLESGVSVERAWWAHHVRFPSDGSAVKDLTARA